MLTQKFKHEIDFINSSVELKFESDSNDSCFAEDDSLPALPLPDLAQTLQLYLESVRPHVTEQQFQVTKQLVLDFENGVGKELQRLLKQRASVSRNWLDLWWTEYAYLRSRVPALPKSNMSGPDYIHRCLWFPSDEPGIRENRVSQFLHYLLRFWRIIRMEKLVKEKRRDGRSLAMYQFKNLFNTCRIPKQSKDELVSYFRTIREGGHCPRHIIVMYMGRMFLMTPVDENNRIWSPPVLERALRRITDTYSNREWGASVGALTTLPRDEWAVAREDLAQLGDNARLLELISEAILVLSLESDSPNSEDNVLWYTMCADARNRWGDKAYNLLSFKNGVITNSCDHTPMEGVTISTGSLFVEFSIYNNGGKWSPNIETDPECVVDSIVDTAAPLYEELKFSLTSKQSDLIEQAVIQHRNVCSTIAAKDFVYTKFGRLFLRSFDMHPDTVVQLALQLAFYRAHAFPPSVYETASTRHHWRGRTETIRSCTPASVAWIKSMEAGSPVDPRTIDLFLAAHKRHNELRTQCEAGLGCDRHLLGLQAIAIESGLPMPEIFVDPSWRKSGGGANFHLSTSFSGYLVCLGIIPAMIEDGYGAFYRVGPEMVHTFVSSYRSSTVTDIERFCQQLEKSLDDISYS